MTYEDDVPPLRAHLAPFTDDQIRVLSDMTDLWLSKDRQGDLVRDWGYTADMIKASDTLFGAVSAEWRRRGLA